MLTTGAICFGVVIGWIVYRTLRRSKTNGISDIAAVLGAVGGAVVIQLFPAGTNLFGAYSIGLFVGFFFYLIIGGIVEVRSKTRTSLKSTSIWLGSEPTGYTAEEEKNEN